MLLKYIYCILHKIKHCFNVTLVCLQTVCLLCVTPIALYSVLHMYNSPLYLQVIFLTQYYIRYYTVKYEKCTFQAKTAPLY